MLRLENDLGETIFIKIDSDIPHEVPHITIRKGTEIGKTYHITPIDILSIKNHFGNYIHLPSLAIWLEKEQKEIVTKEDLNHMLTAVKSLANNLLRQRDNLIEAMNALNSIYDRYSKEKGNEQSNV